MDSKNTDDNSFKRPVRSFEERCKEFASILDLNRIVKIPEALKVARSSFRADLATAILINDRKEHHIIRSVHRPIKPRFKRFEEWIDVFEADAKEKALTTIQQATETGNFWEIKEKENRKKKTGLRPTLIVLKLPITEYYFPACVKCVLCFFYEDVEEIFIQRDKLSSQISRLSIFFLNWFRELDPKRVLEPGAGHEGWETQIGWLKRINDVLKILDVKFIQLPIYMENLVPRSIECVKIWFKYSYEKMLGKIKLPKGIFDSLSSNKSKWKNYYFKDGFDHRAYHLYFICYWSWWRGAGTGWISDYRSKKVDDFEDEIKKEIKKGFDRLEENEKELRDFLKDRFLKLTA